MGKPGRPMKNGDLANERKLSVCYRIEPENKEKLQQIIEYHKNNGEKVNASVMIDLLIAKEYTEIKAN